MDRTVEAVNLAHVVKSQLEHVMKLWILTTAC